MRRVVLLLLLIFPASLRAYDFGVTLTQDVGYGGIGSGAKLDYEGGLIPYFTASFGDSGYLYISAWAKIVYEYERIYFTGELLHTEFSWRVNNFKIRAGRIPYAAPLDFIAEGFFDGVQASFDTKIGTFNAGGWYTGLLYKKSANITMTPEDLLSYNAYLDYRHFSNTYFASRRVLAAVGWENPDIAGMIRAKAAVLGQIDLNGDGTPYNSMYISAKALIPVKRFVISTGVCLQMAKAGSDTGIGLAGELGGSWIAPTPFSSRLSLVGRYSSGKTGSIDPFVPITTKPQGDVLQARLSGISTFLLDYSAKLHPTVSAGLSASYYIRNDKETYTAYPVNPADNGGSALGCELFGRAVWNPLTDLSVNLGAGIFLPSTGDVNPKAGVQWRVELGLSLVVY